MGPYLKKKKQYQYYYELLIKSAKLIKHLTSIQEQSQKHFQVGGISKKVGGQDKTWG